ncbi:DUF2575 domain-containing protein [Photorhabdus akhurstii]|nr:DUF2575 domain-containing protein [Photorhabdus akhurstii]
MYRGNLFRCDGAGFYQLTQWEYSLSQ